MVGIEVYKKPKSCTGCIYYYDESYKCSVTDTILDFENAEKHTPNNCPLIEIKE